LIDPPALSEEDRKEIEALGRPHRIYLSNKHHTRSSAVLRAHFHCPLYIHEDDAPLMEIPVDGTFSDGEILENELEAVRIPDAKTPGECAFYWKKNGVLIVGDAVIGKPPGALSLLPDEKFRDPQRFKQGLLVLRGLEYDTLLVGDGSSLLSGARPIVEAFLQQWVVA
jgi:glyoxylase-like metal-dependent hydrolase (beta-lactamase superfamily II)